MINWKEVDPEISAIPGEKWFSSLSAIDVVRIFSPSQISTIVKFGLAAKHKIYSHIQNLDSELGGLFVGLIYSFSSMEFDSSSVSLKMDVDLWNRVRCYETENILIVSWYHSHPKLWAFFSETDRYTQPHFFKKPYSIGLVIDPIRGEEKMFLRQNSEEVPKTFIAEFK